MPHLINRLNDRRVKALKTPGRHADGGGLYLVVDKSGAKRWVFMSWRGGRQIEIGLGGLTAVSLKIARETAAACRALAKDGCDPRHAMRAARATPSFGEMADDVIQALSPGFRNAKHAQQWRNTLATHAALLRDKPVDAVTTDDVLAVLKPIWTSKPETASRVRGRIEKVLDAAKAKGYRSGENPAHWRGHLSHFLSKRKKLTRGHHPAMPFEEVPGFVCRLHEMDAIAARCLEFVILTACRSGEVLKSIRGGVVMGARWEEMDTERAVWTVPALRMKTEREHRVPLSPRAMGVLQEMKRLKDDAFVFPGQRRDTPLSGMALEMVMRRLKVKPFTVHGFRSSFRDWVGETTDFPRELAEAALAHAVGDAVERAYRRGDALEKRRAMMQDWADHCLSQ